MFMVFLSSRPQAKYKGTSKADLSDSLYKRLPATIDSVFAREVTQLQSEVRFSSVVDAIMWIKHIT